MHSWSLLNAFDGYLLSGAEILPVFIPRRARVRPARAHRAERIYLCMEGTLRFRMGRFFADPPLLLHDSPTNPSRNRLACLIAGLMHTGVLGLSMQDRSVYRSSLLLPTAAMF